MKISNQLKEIMKKNDVSMTQLAINANTSQPNLTNKFSRDNLKLSDVQEIADALSYHTVEIIFRGNNETIIIREDKPITVVPNTRYLIYDEDTTLVEEFEKHGINDVTFREVVLELLDAEFEKQFNDLWNITIPKRLEVEMRELANKVVSPLIKSATNIE